MIARAASYAVGLAALCLCAGCCWIGARRAVAACDARNAGCREEVVRLQAELERKDADLKDRDASIKALKEKLRSFGVF